MSNRKKEDVTPKDSVRTLLSASIALSSISLDLRSKQLSFLFVEFALLHRLEYLYLEGNILEELPAEVVRGWRALRWLDLRNNLLQRLPSAIGELKNLRTLLLAGNRISELPVELGNLSKLSGLNLSGNPLLDPPKSVVQQGVRQVLSYLLKKQAESQTQQIPEFTQHKHYVPIHSDRSAYPSEYPPEEDPGPDMPPELTLKRVKLFAMQGIRNPVPRRFPSPANFSLYSGPIKQNQPFVLRKPSLQKKIRKDKLPPLTHDLEKRSLMQVIHETAVPPNSQQRLAPAWLEDPAAQARLVLQESKSGKHLLDIGNHEQTRLAANRALALMNNSSGFCVPAPQAEERLSRVRADRPKEARLRREADTLSEEAKAYEIKSYSLTPFTGGLDII